MIQKITQNNWNFWTANLIMRAKKLLTSRQIFRYAVPARTVTKKHWRKLNNLLIFIFKTCTILVCRFWYYVYSIRLMTCFISTADPGTNINSPLLAEHATLIIHTVFDSFRSIFVNVSVQRACPKMSRIPDPAFGGRINRPLGCLLSNQWVFKLTSKYPGSGMFLVLSLLLYVQRASVCVFSGMFNVIAVFWLRASLEKSAFSCHWLQLLISAGNSVSFFTVKQSKNI